MSKTGSMFFNRPIFSWMSLLLTAMAVPIGIAQEPVYDLDSPGYKYCSQNEGTAEGNIMYFSAVFEDTILNQSYRRGFHDYVVLERGEPLRFPVQCYFALADWLAERIRQSVMEIATDYDLTVVDTGWTP